MKVKHKRCDSNIYKIDRDIIDDRLLDTPMVIFDEFDDCLIGITDSLSGQPTACYSSRMIIEKLMNDRGIDFDEAYEHFNFNIFGSYLGETTPIFITDF